MPIFEYRCRDCGSRFEKLIRREGEEQSLVCPQCGAASPDKELSTFAAQVAGPKGSSGPMCPSGGSCPTPGACGLN